MLCVGYRGTNSVCVLKLLPQPCCTDLVSSLGHSFGRPISVGIGVPIVSCGGVSVLIGGCPCTLWHEGRHPMIWPRNLGASYVSLFYSDVSQLLLVRGGAWELVLQFA